VNRGALVTVEVKLAREDEIRVGPASLAFCAVGADSTRRRR
jgi:hypothetical protein